MDHIAHIRISPDGGKIIQSTGEHCRNVEKYSGELLRPVGLESLGRLAGLLHDMGKFTVLFDSYITAAAEGKDPKRGSVNHTFAAVIFLFERYHKDGGSVSDAACEIAAYAAGAHHGQFDCCSPEGADGFLHRIQKDRAEIHYDEALSDFLESCAGLSEIDALFEKAVSELTALFPKIKGLAHSRDEYSFYYALLCRLVLSALIDADRQDTAEFKGNFSFPEYPKDMSTLWQKQLEHAENLMKNFRSDSEINCARKKISDLCRAFAEKEGGIFRLAVPTGGGKTLSSLRYALAHAQKFGKSRIVYIIPLLSIIEQNAAVLKKYVSDESLILEHHSDIVKEKTEKSDVLDEHELLLENWRSPIIISTMVQLLNTLFLGKSASIRRMNSLADSVIIIDEVQSVPVKMVSLFSLAMNFLSEICGATIVLCSATQPCFERTEHPLLQKENCRVVPFDRELLEPFRRTEIFDRRTASGYSAADAAALARAVQAESGSLLIICNTKKEAKEIFAELEQGDYSLFHLSTSMCMKHRKDTLDEINLCLKIEDPKPVICVSTQLVEAGIDFSFGAVIRVSAGMDNIAQAAGRCNRNGEFGRLCPVYVINFRDENLSALEDIKCSKIAAEELMESFRKNSAAYGESLLSEEAVTYYYKRLFGTKKPGAMDFTTKDPNSSIFLLLGTNKELTAKCRNKDFSHFLCQAFATAGDNFRVFDENTTEVIVPYNDKAKQTIAALCSPEAEHNFIFAKDKLKEAKPYSVSLFSYQLEALRKNGGVFETDLFIHVQPGFYDEKTGIEPEGAKNSDLGVFR